MQTAVPHRSTSLLYSNLSSGLVCHQGFDPIRIILFTSLSDMTMVICIKVPSFSRRAAICVPKPPVNR